MALGKECSCDPAGAAAGQRDFLAERKLCETREELIFGDALECGRRTNRQCELSEIHQVEIFDEAQVGEPRRVRGECKSPLDAVVFEQAFADADFFEDFDREIFAIEQEAELCFVERGIVEEREQDIGRVVMNECREIVTSGGEDLLLVGVDSDHSTSLLTAGLLLAASWDLRTMRLVRAPDAPRLRLGGPAKGQSWRAARSL